MDIVPQLIMNSLIAGAIYTMIALGFNLIYGTVKFFDLGYGALTAVGGYSVYYFSNLLGLDIYISVLLGLLIAGLIGFLVNKFVYKKLRERKASSMVFLVASLGVFTALQAVIAILFSSQFQTLSRNTGGEETFQILGGIVTQTQLIIFVLGLVVMALLALVLKFTKFGLAPVSTGEVLWHERKVEPISYEMVDRGISFVPQGRRVLKSLTVKENLEIGAYTVKSRNEIKERLAEVLETSPALKLKLYDKSGSLSGGQQQMLAIARGLMTDPKVLLLDEPTLGLAPKIVKEVFEKIKEINDKHKTAIMVVEHNIKSLLDIADRAYILDKGKVVWADGADKLKDSDILEKVFTGRLNV